MSASLRVQRQGYGDRKYSSDHHIYSFYIILSIILDVKSSTIDLIFILYAR